MGENVARRMFDMAQGEFARGMHEEALRLCDRSLQMYKLEIVEDFRATVVHAKEGGCCSFHGCSYEISLACQPKVQL
jgi:hypothetical protein